MFCSKCGNEIPTEAAYCQKCGASIRKTEVPKENKPTNNQSSQTNTNTGIGIALIVAGCLIAASFILYCYFQMQL